MIRDWSGTSGVLVMMRSLGGELKYMITQQACQEVSTCFVGVGQRLSPKLLSSNRKLPCRW